MEALNPREDEAIREEVVAGLVTLGLRLSAARTPVVHLDEGFDFLGWRIHRRRKRGTGQRYLYTYPSKKTLLSVGEGSDTNPQSTTPEAV